MNYREKVKEIERKLKEDPFIVIKRKKAKERIHVILNQSTKDAITEYFNDNKANLKDDEITSRNKLVADIIEKWCEENNLLKE